MRIKITTPKVKKELKPSSKKNEQCCSSHEVLHGCSSSAREEDIRKKAYELYEQRGCQPGNELGDWFEAEKLCSKS